VSPGGQFTYRYSSGTKKLKIRVNAPYSNERWVSYKKADFTTGHRPPCEYEDKTGYVSTNYSDEVKAKYRNYCYKKTYINIKAYKTKTYNFN
jgi:hypothetical protein